MATEDLIGGLQSAIGAYAQASEAKQAREERRRMQDLEFKSKGLIPKYDEKGNISGFSKDPEFEEQRIKEKQEEENLGLLKAGLIPAGMDPEKVPQVNTKLYQARAAASPFGAMSPGQKAADTSFGKEYSDWEAGGGSATVEKNLGLLGGAITELKKPKQITGGLTTKIPILGSDFAQDIINPDMSKVRDMARTAIQTSLRPILGGQFAAIEGEQILSRAFNARMSNEENARRLQAELDAIKSMADKKDEAIKYFQENGTLQGFKSAKKPGLLQGAQPQQKSGPAPGSIVNVNGKRFKVGADGDSLEPIQ